MVNGNRNPAAYEALGVQVRPDAVSEFPGRLAGMQAGLNHCATPWLVCAPCNTPHFPTGLVERRRQPQAPTPMLPWPPRARPTAACSASRCSACRADRSASRTGLLQRIGGLAVLDGRIRTAGRERAYLGGDDVRD